MLGALHGGAVGQVVVQDEPADVGRAHLALARAGGVDGQCDLSPVQKTLEAVRLSGCPGCMWTHWMSAIPACSSTSAVPAVARIR